MVLNLILFSSQLKMNGTGRNFNSQWCNYEVATDLTAHSKRKRAAVFLACVGTDACDTADKTIEFEDESHKEDIDRVISAFHKHCVGEVNVTYERYFFK